MKLVKVFFVFMAIVACKKEQQLIVPECLLSETEMINLMVDVSLVKSAKSVGRKELKDSGIKPIEYLFIKHGVDTVAIRENIEYYNNDLNKSKELYNKIADTLKKRQEILEIYVDSLPSSKEENEKDELLEEEVDSLSSSNEKNKKDKLPDEVIDSLSNSKKNQEDKLSEQEVVKDD